MCFQASIEILFQCELHLPKEDPLIWSFLSHPESSHFLRDVPFRYKPSASSWCSCQHAAFTLMFHSFCLFVCLFFCVCVFVCLFVLWYWDYCSLDCGQDRVREVTDKLQKTLTGFCRGHRLPLATGPVLPGQEQGNWGQKSSSKHKH